jgi:uncharacterized protein YciI
MSDEHTHHLLTYEYVENMLERRAPHREAHLAHVRAGREDGAIIMAGALGDPPVGGALVFRDVDRAKVEAFVRNDPYVVNELVTSWRIEPWRLV